MFSEFGPAAHKIEQKRRRKKENQVRIYTWNEFLKLGEDIDNRVIVKSMVK